MMWWPSGVTTLYTLSVCPLEGVDERAVDVVQPDLAPRPVARPTTKCTPSGSAATQNTSVAKAHREVRSSSPASMNSFAVPSPSR